MNDVDKIKNLLIRACTANGIRSEVVINEAGTKGVMILDDRDIGPITTRLRDAALAEGVSIQCHRPHSRPVLVITQQGGKVSHLLAEANQKYKPYFGRLMDALDGVMSEDLEDGNDPLDGQQEEILPEKNSPRQAKKAKPDSRPGISDQFAESADYMERLDLDADKRLMEALTGIAVPDGAVQPKQGVEMLKLALATKTRAGLTLGEQLKKAGITYKAAEPGSHIVVFTKGGQEVWRVEPITMSDKKIFEQTVDSLWSIANGKAPNARELEREAAKQKAKELGDSEKEVSGMVDQIISKYVPQEQDAQIPDKPQRPQ